jgi:hypothetical protein
MTTSDERQMQFVYARYHVTGLFAQRQSDVFSSTLQKMQASEISGEKYTWSVGDVGKSHSLIFGRLGKTAREVIETHYDKKTHSFRREQTQNRKAAYSNFFVDSENAIIALEDKPLLPRNTFLRIFKKFWQDTGLSDIDFDFIKSELEIFEVLKRWEKITEARFDLSPTNPHPREDFAPLDDIIKRAKAKRARLRFEAGHGGLSKHDSIVQQGTSMSAAGYGEFALKGIENGSKTVLSSKSLLITNELVRVDDLEGLTPEMLSEIRKVVKQIQDGKTQK